MSAFVLAVMLFAAAPPGRIVWTFDDGPHRWTPRILDLLRCHGVRGTFFVLGGQLNTPARIASLRQTVRDGHLLGNHLFTHRSPCRLSVAGFRWELRRAAAMLDGITGQRRADRRWYRPPHGHRCHRALLAAEGYRTLLWHVADLGLTPAQIWHRAQRYLRMGETTILLFHYDWRKLQAVLRMAAAAGYVKRCKQ